MRYPGIRSKIERSDMTRIRRVLFSFFVYSLILFALATAAFIIAAYAIAPDVDCPTPTSYRGAAACLHKLLN